MLAVRVESLDRIEAGLSEGGRDASIDFVEALDDAGLDRPDSHQSFLHLAHGVRVVECCASRRPLGVDVVQIPAADRAPVVGEIGDSLASDALSAIRRRRGIAPTFAPAPRCPSGRACGRG